MEKGKGTVLVDRQGGLLFPNKFGSTLRRGKIRDYSSGEAPPARCKKKPRAAKVPHHGAGEGKWGGPTTIYFITRTLRGKPCRSRGEVALCRLDGRYLDEQRDRNPSAAWEDPS